MQQSSSHLPTSPLWLVFPWFPPWAKQLLCRRGGLNWPWVRRELRAPLRALEFRCVHQRGHKVHSRRTSAYREYCGGLAMLELFLSALLVQNGQIPAQHLAKSDAGISSG